MDAARFSHALVTYTANEQITADILQLAYTTRSARGRRAANFNILEMHTRTVDGIHYLALRFTPTQSRGSFRMILDNIQADLNVDLVEIPGSDFAIYTGTEHINSVAGVTIRNIIRDNGPPHRHSFFSNGVIAVNHPSSILRLGQLGRARGARQQQNAPEPEAVAQDEHVNIRYEDAGQMEIEPIEDEAGPMAVEAPVVDAPPPAEVAAPPVVEEEIIAAPVVVEAPVVAAPPVFEAPVPSPSSSDSSGAPWPPPSDSSDPPSPPAPAMQSGRPRIFAARRVAGLNFPAGTWRRIPDEPYPRPASPSSSSSSSSYRPGSPRYTPGSPRARSPPAVTPHTHLIDRIIRLENAVRRLGGNV